MIPVSEPLLTPQDLEAVQASMKAGWVSSAGPVVERFEQEWSRYCGRTYGIGVNSGTAALQAAIGALRLEKGDEVILPTFTIISCPAAVIYSDATPVLVDADPRTWTMDVGQVADRINSRTKAIMAVHIYGHPVDLDPLQALAERHGLALLEDAAEAHGAEYLAARGTPSPTWRRCGGFGALSCFSFYGNKLITTGEGGMIVTDDRTLAERVRSLRNLCFQPGRRFLHEELGFSFRLTSLQAALGVSQLGRMDQIVARKRWIAAEYTRRLQDIPGLQLPIEESWARSVYWMYGIVLAENMGLDAARFSNRMTELGVETRPFFLGMHEQPALLGRGLFSGERYPVAERLARQGLYLPSGLSLTESQIDVVSESVRRVLTQDVRK